MSAFTPTSTSQSVASTSTSAADAFDAVVQAANPSHPNHAAWVERYGGSLSRKNTHKVDEEDADDHLEKSSQSSQRRRKPSNGGSRNSVLSRSSPARDRAASIEAHGKLPSRESSIRTSNQQSSSRPPLPGSFAGINNATLSEESTQRRKRKKKRDKGKEKGEAPPIPPPRTTSQALPSGSPIPSTSGLYPGHASTSTISTMQATPSMRQTHTPSSIGSPPTPSTSLPHTHNNSITSRNNSISHQGMTTSSYEHHTRDSKLPGKSPMRSNRQHSTVSNDPPARLSSMFSRNDDANEEQILPSGAINAYIPEFSPSQSISSHTVSRRNSRKSVDFALPEEPQRRGSFDMYGIRKNFDTLVSPFREGKRQTSLSRIGYSSKTMDPGTFTAVPILKNASQDSSLAQSFDSPTTYVGHVARPLSCVKDEGEIIDIPVETNLNAMDQSMSLEDNPKEADTQISMTTSTEVPTHPLALITSPAARSESMTEEGDDFFDAESDEGGNGSSADDRGTPRKLTSSAASQSGNQTPTSKRRVKRKSSENQNASRARAKSAASGLGVEGVSTAVPSSNTAGAAFPSTEKADSSASEFEGTERDLRDENCKSLPREGKADGRTSTNKHRSTLANIVTAPQPAAVLFPAPTISSSHQMGPQSTIQPISSLQRDEKERVVSSREVRGVERKLFPSRGIDEPILPDRIYQDDGENRKYPFETSPSAYYFPSSTSTRSITSWNQIPRMSPMSAEQTSVISAPLSGTSGKDQTKEQPTLKSVGKSSKGAFAGVMARMRRDRSNNTAFPTAKADVTQQFFEASPTVVESTNVENNTNVAIPLGLGIATTNTSTSVASIESTPQSQSKGWRTRLISFSQKSSKSPKMNSEEVKKENPLPPLPPPSLPTIPPTRSPIENVTQIRAVFDDTNVKDALKEGNKVAPLHEVSNRIKRSKSKSKGDINHVSPTIHKTLSPALLTEQNYEADEVASFVGSERDLDSKRETWNSLNDFELPPDQILNDSRIGETIIATRKQLNKNLDQDGNELASPASLTSRRFPSASPNIVPRMASRSSDAGLRKIPPSPLRMPPPPPPPPIPSLPRRSEANDSVMNVDQSSPVSRRSLDVRMYRSGSNPHSPGLNGGGDGHTRGHSFALNRDQVSTTYRSPKVPFSPTSIGTFTTPKISKRFFSGNSTRGKGKTQGISSDNFHLSGGISSMEEGLGRLPFSKSEVCLVNIGRSPEEKYYRGRQGTTTDDILMTPSNSNSHSQIEHGSPVTPKNRHVMDEETSAFDKMLRDRAKDDAARLRQITAQARAQQSPA